MKSRIIAAMTLLCAVSFSALSQTVIYSLPSTTIHLTVEASKISYTPGPYAAYAKKYLGIDVSQEASTTYTLSTIKITPYIEADKNNSFIINLENFNKKTPDLSFLKLCSQGLIMLSDDQKGESSQWRFPSPSVASSDIGSNAVTSNLTSTESVLYRTEINDAGGYERVAYKQSQVVEKSPEKKASEAAATILALRENRINIITGNTDATFSGDALRAAIEEIDRIEKNLMRLFTGTTEVSVQTMNFDAIPKNTKEKEILVAFRISETSGLLPSEEIAGNPIVLEITPESTTDTTDQYIAATGQNSSRAKYDSAQMGNLVYRVPAICNIRLSDGYQTILQTRLPIYQKGTDLTFPMSITLK